MMSQRVKLFQKQDDDLFSLYKHVFVLQTQNAYCAQCEHCVLFPHGSDLSVYSQAKLNAGLAD
jgi:hypothetical protein